MIINYTMHFIFAYALLSFLIQRIKGLPYSSMNDLYDTNYEYEFGENQAREEVFITQTPQFLSPSLDLVVNEGHTVRLPCLVDRLDGFVLLWRKNNQIISVGSQIIDKSNSKIQLDEVDNGNTLVIQQADHTDEAEYTCSVSAYRKTELKHDIRIRVKPVITTSPQEHLIVNEGDTAKLSCQLQLGTPIPKLKWRKCEGDSFISGEDELLENVLKFATVTRDDSGCYVCEADNGFAEEPITSMVMLVVEYPPNVQIQNTEYSSDVTTITCTVESEPEAEVTWLKDGEKIDADNKIIIINKNTLQLVDFDAEYYGSYTCKAKNKLGSVEESVIISGRESDAGSYANIGESKRTFAHFEKTLHEPLIEEGYSPNIHESERRSESITDNSLTKDIAKGNKRTIPRKSSGKIYFARVPSFYTLPEKESNLLPKKRSHILESRPKNVNEFLKLLRIYHQSHALRDKTDSIYKEDNLTQEHTTDNNLLRSTHSYVGHLNTELDSESVIKVDQVDERLFATSPQEKNIQDQRYSEERKTTRTIYEEMITYKEAQPKKEININEKRGKMTKLLVSNSKSSSINGRYLEENEILTEDASLKDPIETDILYTSNTSAMLRGHLAKENNLGLVKAEDIFVQQKKEHKTQQENKNIDNLLDDINEERMLHNNIKKDKEREMEESEPRETMAGKTFRRFSTGTIGTRYLDDSNIKEIQDNKTDEQNGKNLPVFRGQHILQTSLKDIDSEEHHTLLGFGKNGKLSEPPKKTDQFDEDDKLYLRTRDGDYSEETETLQETEPKTKNNDADFNVIEANQKNNDADQMLTNSRYLKEDQIKEESEETQKDLTITKSKVLRGHHSIQSSLADTKEGKLEISSSNSGITHSLGSSLKINIQNKKKGQFPNNEHIEKEDITGANENMYPEEIMNIEKIFFTKLSNSDLPKSDTIHPLLSPKEEVKLHELQKTSKIDKDNENDATHHPLQIPTAQVYTETKVQFRGNHSYEKGLLNVNSETVIGKDDKKSSEWSKPLRGDHSYNQRIEDIENKDNKDNNENKQIKQSYGPHPFRGLRFRVP